MDPQPSPSSLPSAPGSPARRPIQLTILLAVLLLMNAAGLVRGLTAREQILQEIPRLTPALFTLWLAAPPLTILGILGLWNLRRWGLYLIGLGWVLAIVVDMLVGATNHAILATGLMWLVVLFVRPVRGELR